MIKETKQKNKSKTLPRWFIGMLFGICLYSFIIFTSILCEPLFFRIANKYFEYGQPIFIDVINVLLAIFSQGLHLFFPALSLILSHVIGFFVVTIFASIVFAKANTKNAIKIVVIVLLLITLIVACPGIYM
jgi:hypothetical protein